MPERGIPPAIDEVVQRVEVVPRSDARDVVLVRDQLAALAALITLTQENDYAGERQHADAPRAL